MAESVRPIVDERGQVYEYGVGWTAPRPELRVIVSPFLPIVPRPEEVGRRIARHVFADELRELGHDVGPLPDEVSHAFRIGQTIVCSQEFADALTVFAHRPTGDDDR